MVATRDTLVTSQVLEEETEKQVEQGSMNHLIEVRRHELGGDWDEAHLVHGGASWVPPIRPMRGAKDLADKLAPINPILPTRVTPSIHVHPGPATQPLAKLHVNSTQHLSLPRDRVNPEGGVRELRAVEPRLS